MLSYKCARSLLLRGQNVAPSGSGRAGATPRTFWAAESRKRGVAPARFGSFPAVAFEIPALDIPLPQNLRRGESEDLGEERCEG